MKRFGLKHVPTSLKFGLSAFLLAALPSAWGSSQIFDWVLLFIFVIAL